MLRRWIRQWLCEHEWVRGYVGWYVCPKCKKAVEV